MFAQRVAEPLQRAAGGERDAHHVPLAVHRVAERVQPALGIDLRRVAVDEHDAGRADRRREHALAHDAIADRAGRTVARAADDHAIGREAEQLRRFRRQLAGDFFRFVAAWRTGSASSSSFDEQLFRPAAMHDIEQQHAAGVADFGGEFAGQPAADFILRQQHLHRLGEILRLVVAQPEDFRRGEAGERRIGDHLDELLPPAGPLLDFFTLGGRPLVVPQQGPPHDVVLLVEKHRAVHLAREADRPHVGRLELRLLHDGADRLHRRLPPIVRVLLTPERFGMVARVRGHRLAEDFARSLMASVLVPEVPMSMPR